MGMTPLKQAAALGQSIWIDYLSRDLLQSGRLMRLVSEGVVGVTSNPTIFEQAISAGKGYDEQLRDVRARTSDPKEMFLELAVRDVTEACDQLREVYDAGIAAMRDTARPRHVDGLVSIEVDPSFAYDTEATTAEAKRLHALIDRPNLLVKIPATKPGLPAIEDMIAAGHSINVTLIFSLQRYAEVAEAYIRGIERLVAAGGDPSRVVSVASFFVSRVDTETDRRLDELGAPPELKGKLAIANAKLAYRHYKQAFSSERWEYLASKGAMTQRCLWASTSTKNPAYSDVLYVEELIGPETVNTLPEKTILAFQDHGRASATLERGIDEAEALLERLSDVGIDYDDVTETLERQGVQAFADSFEKLLNGIRTRALAA
ncbi:MAG: transaldolase [Gammaproteobacteria bacterium]